MSLAATREFACVQALLHLLRREQSVLVDLADMKELRALGEGVAVALREGVAQGVLAEDPIGGVLADWERLVEWSNRIQDMLREADELAWELDPPATGAPRPATAGAKPVRNRPAVPLITQARLQQWELALETKSKRLLETIEAARSQLLESDWVGEQPYRELAEVVEVNGLDLDLSFAESPCDFGESSLPLFKPLIASRQAVASSSPLVAKRVAVLNSRLESARRLLVEHRRHAAELSAIDALIENGEVDSAGSRFRLLKATFPDLDYKSTGKRLAAAIQQRNEAEQKCIEAEMSGLKARKALENLVPDVSCFSFFPPWELSGRCRGKLAEARATVTRLKFEAGKKSGSELARRLESVADALQAFADTFERESVTRVRRTVRLVSISWLSVFLVAVASVAGWGVLKAMEARRLADMQERERASQIVAAQAKAVAALEAEERARVAAAAKQQRERLLAEEKARAMEVEAAELIERKRASAIALAKASAEDEARALKAEARVAAEWEREHARFDTDDKAKAEAAEKEQAVFEKLGLSWPSPAQAGSPTVIGGDFSTAMAVVWIPAGYFQMGSPDSELDRKNDETSHRVLLSRGFFMAETECTQLKWDAVMGGEPGLSKVAKQPVANVSWDDARKFCRKLTELHLQKGKLPARWRWDLPTEAQWEYACRAGASGSFEGKLETLGWYAGNSDDEAHPVGTHEPNKWGLYDMHGNMWEWCLDWHEAYPLRSLANPTGPRSGLFRVGRGGSWKNQSPDCRSASRGRFMPNDRTSNVGFRPVLVSE